MFRGIKMPKITKSACIRFPTVLGSIYWGSIWGVDRFGGSLDYSSWCYAYQNDSNRLHVWLCVRLLFTYICAQHWDGRPV